MQDKSDANPESNVNDPFKDDDILDLADDLLADSDEEIFDLTEMPDSGDKGEDDILDLTDVVGDAEGKEEEIMDLTDIAMDSSTSEDDILELEDILEDSDAEGVESLDIEATGLDQKEPAEMDVELSFDEDMPDSAAAAPEDKTQSDDGISAIPPEPPQADTVQEQVLTLDDSVEDSAVSPLFEPQTPQENAAEPDAFRITDTMDLTDVAPETIEEAFKFETPETELSDDQDPAPFSADTTEFGAGLSDEDTELSLEDDFSLDDLDPSEVKQSHLEDADNIVLDETLDLSDLEREINDQGLDIEFDAENTAGETVPPPSEPAAEVAVDPLLFDTASTDATAEAAESFQTDVEAPPAETDSADLDFPAFEEIDDTTEPGVSPEEDSAANVLDLSAFDEPAAEAEPSEFAENMLDAVTKAESASTDQAAGDALMFTDLDRDMLNDESGLESDQTPAEQLPATGDYDESLIEDAPPAAAVDAAADSDDDFIESLGMTIESEVDLMQPEPPADSHKPPEAVPHESWEEKRELRDEAEQRDVIDKPAVAVESAMSTQQLESAIENVVRNMFSDKIESILNRVIEQTVSREIERLKKLLLEDSAEDR